MERYNREITHSKIYIAIATVVLVIIMVIGFLLCSRAIDRSLTKTLQDTMSSSCKNAVESLSSYINMEQQSLGYYADLLSTGENDTTPFGYADIMGMLNSLCAPNSVVSSGIVYEDGRLLRYNGSNYEDTPVSFEDEAPLGSHVSSVVDSSESSTGKVIRIFAPVFNHNRISAMLYLSLDPGYFTAFFKNSDDYSDDKLLLIINAMDDSVIYSTYTGDDPGMASLTTGSRLTAFDPATVSQGELSTLRLEGSEQNWDYYSKSFALGQWYAITMVKHNAGLSLVDNVSTALMRSFIIMLIPLFVFLIIIIMIEHRTLVISRTFSDSLSYMHRIGFSLTNAAMNPERINEALGIMAGQYSTAHASFFIVRFGKIRNVYSTDGDFEKKAKKQITGTSLKSSYPEFYEHLLAGDYILVNLPEKDTHDRTDDLSEQIRIGRHLGGSAFSAVTSVEDTGSDSETEDRAFETFSSTVVSMNYERTPIFRHIPGTRLMCVPIRGNENTLTGILIVSDPHIPEKKLRKYEAFSHISSVAPDFSMVSTSVEAYALIKNMGTIDFTTGLLNRNAYKNALEELDIPDGQPFACIFIDVNGLHEMNNTYGHDKGDEMLHYVADTLKTVFPDDEVFRIGGDEFMIFARNHSMSLIDLRVAHINRLIAEADYAVSIGVEWREFDHNISEMITAADHKMYEAKKRYYESAGRDRRSRDRRSDDRDSSGSYSGPDRRGGGRRAEDRRGDDRRAEDRRAGDRRASDRRQETETPESSGGSSGDSGNIIITRSYTGPDRRGSRRNAVTEEHSDIQSIMDKYKPSGGHKGSISEILAEAEEAAHQYDAEMEAAARNSSPSSAEIKPPDSSVHTTGPEKYEMQLDAVSHSSDSGTGSDKPASPRGIDMIE